MAVALALLLSLGGCGKGNLAAPTPTSSPSDAPTDEQAAAQRARSSLETGHNPKKVTNDLGCLQTTVTAYNAADGGTAPVEMADETVIWVCDFDVIFTRPSNSGLAPTPVDWPKEGVARIARVVLLPNGAITTRYFEETPPSLAPA
jgi:hypothetical protein